LTGFAPNENEGTLRIMAKWIIIFLISVIVYKNMTHAIDLDKLEMQLAWAESKTCPKPVKCPEFKPCMPQVVQLPCIDEAPPVVCDRCPTYWEMCLEE